MRLPIPLNAVDLNSESLRGVCPSYAWEASHGGLSPREFRACAVAGYSFFKVDMARDEERVSFTRAFGFLRWLLPVTHNFPRAYRHSFARRLLDASFDLQEHLEVATLRRGNERLIQLQLVDEALAKVRVY